MNAIGRNNSIKTSFPAPAFAGRVTAVPADVSGQRGKFGILLLAFYVFLLVSRVLDLSPIWWLRVPLILLILLVVLTVARGEIGHAFSSPTTKVFGLFTIWVVVCFPFSYWRAGSIDSVHNAVESFVIFVIIVQMVRTWDDWQKIAGGYAFAAFIASLYGFHFARYEGGRLSLVGGTFADPNDFALTLLVGLPFLWLKASLASDVKKIFYWIATLPVFMTVARTGSRAGMLAAASITVVSFLFAKPGQKVLIAVCAVVGLAAGAVFLPPYLKARYLTVLSPDSTTPLDAGNQSQLGADMASSNERQLLLKQSIHMTFEHPLFGVGPGVFSFAAWDERKATEGAGGLALVSHNTYTQISSETGLPGFFLFIGTVFLCVKYTLSDYRSLKEKDPESAKFARYLLVSMSGLFPGIFFLSVGYTHFLALFIAMSASLHIVMNTKTVEAPRASSFSPVAGTTARKTPPLRKRVPSYLRSRGLVSPNKAEMPVARAEDER